MKNKIVLIIGTLLVLSGASYFLYESNRQGIEQDNNSLKSIIRLEVVNGERFCQDKKYPEAGYQKILKAIYSDNSEKILYSTNKDKEAEEGCLFFETINNQELSPNGKYVLFHKSRWEWGKPYMMNINTGEYVFGDKSDIYVIEEIKWSFDNNNFFLITDINDMLGSGEVAVYVSEYNNPDKIRKIWSTKNQVLFDIRNAIFIDNSKIAFEIGQSSEVDLPKEYTKYQYDFQQDKLETIK